MNDTHLPFGKRPLASGETLLLAHFFICSIGLLKLIYLAAFVIYSKSNVHLIAGRLFYFFSEYSYFADKPTELLQYGLSVLAMFVYYGVALWLLRHSKHAEPGRVLAWALGTAARFWGFLLAVLAVNVLVFLVINPVLRSDAVRMLIGLWLIVLLLPVCEPLLHTVGKRVSTEPNETALSRLSLVLLVLISVQIITVFAQYIVAPLRVPNEFMDIRQYTLLGDQYVENTAYINEHEFGGLNKYDPSIHGGNTPSPRSGTFIEIKNDALTGFIAFANERIFGDDRTDLLRGRKAGARDTRYAYDAANGRLTLRDRMRADERIELSDLAKNEHERALINELYQKSARNSLNAESRIYTEQELDFFKRNRVELVAQAKAGWFFHHHNAMLAPINAFSLGKPASEIDAQYGWLNSIALSKLLEWRGGMSFDTYFSTLYAFYPLYLAILLFVAWVIFRRVHYVLIVGIVSFSAMLVLGQELLRIAPGFNPIRHFFDAFVILCFYLYGSRKQISYLLLAIVFAWLAILCSREFGLFIAIALIVTLAVKQVLDGANRCTRELFLTLLALLGSVACVTVVKPTPYSLLIYSLIGVSAPSFQFSSFYVLLFSISAIYVFVITVLRQNDLQRWTLVCLFFYCQGFIIYYISNSRPHHLWALAPILGLLLTMLLHRTLNSEALRRYEGRICSGIIGVSLFAVYGPTLASYYVRQWEYRQIYATHRVYQWDFDRARFETTMDPTYFRNAVDLIGKYSTSSGIFIISKYDTIVPFLAGRYSEMPYHDVATSLVTQKEVDNCTNLIRASRPEYIFVDTDIERNLNGDIWFQIDPLASANSLYAESFARASVLNLLKKVYAGVKDDYEPVEKGLLITAYRIKSGVK